MLPRGNIIYIVFVCVLLIGCKKEQQTPEESTSREQATEEKVASPTAVEPEEVTPKAGDRPQAPTISKRQSLIIEEARQLLNQVDNEIAQCEFDQAEKTLSQLDGMRKSLSQPLQEKIDAAHMSFNKAKAEEEAKMLLPAETP